MPGASQAVLVVVIVLLLGTLAFLFWPAELRMPSFVSSPAAVPSTAGEAPVHVNAPPAVGPATSASAAPVFPAPALPSTGIPNAASPAPAAVPAAKPASAVAPMPAPRPAASAPLGALPVPAPVPAASAVAALPAGGGVLKLQARSASWVEVVDGRSQILVSRTLAAGEAVGFDGVLPLRVKIGNVSGTEVTFRGRPVDLAPLNRDNVAKLELK
jgi:cytoskeleton protein RodZ